MKYSFHDTLNFSCHGGAFVTTIYHLLQCLSSLNERLANKRVSNDENILSKKDSIIQKYFSLETIHLKMSDHLSLSVTTAYVFLSKHFDVSLYKVCLFLALIGNFFVRLVYLAFLFSLYLQLLFIDYFVKLRLLDYYFLWLWFSLCMLYNL